VFGERRIVRGQHGCEKTRPPTRTFYIQEVAGFPAPIQIEFLAADGYDDSFPAARLDRCLQASALVNVVPAMAVAATITNMSTAGGKSRLRDACRRGERRYMGDRRLEQATRVWHNSRHGDSHRRTLHGANNTFYRTDVAITNRGTTTVSEPCGTSRAPATRSIGKSHSEANSRTSSRMSSAADSTSLATARISDLHASSRQLCNLEPHLHHGRVETRHLRHRCADSCGIVGLDGWRIASDRGSRRRDANHRRRGTARNLPDELRTHRDDGQPVPFE